MKKDEQSNKLAKLLGTFWTSQQTQEALGLPTQSALEAHGADGSALGLTAADGATVYPAFQYHDATASSGGEARASADIRVLRGLRILGGRRSSIHSRT